MRRFRLSSGWFCLCLWVWTQSLFIDTSAQRYFGFGGVDEQHISYGDDFYAPPDRYPYVVSIQHPYTGAHLCVGTLISERWVLTHASCLDTKRYTTAVRNPIIALGSESIVGPFEELHKIDAVKFHPRYTGFTESPYDIVMLRLAEPSKLRPMIAMHSGSPPLLEGLEMRAVGWSRLETGGPYSKKLLEITGLTIIDSKGCYKEHSYPTNISCLHVSNRDVCNGGRGSPIVVPSFPDRLIGIAVGSDVCNGYSRTTGYLSLAFTKDWIQDTIDIFSGYEY